MCGVIGLLSRREAGRRLVEGLLALQHRGQDSAGVLTSNGTFHLKKGNGTVAQVFNPKNLGRLAGNNGIGQVRYPTIGPGSVEDAQPFYLNHPFGIAMVHNGNVTNYADLRRELMQRDFRQLTSFSDVEPILNVFAEELERTDLSRFAPASIFRAVDGVFRRVHGAYSVVALVHRQGMLAFRDPCGIRPLVFAQQNREFGFASESVAFDLLGYRRFSDVKPGEAVLVDNRNKVHRRQVRPATPRPCIFEYVYFARPDSVLDGIGVYDARLRLGERLAAEVALREVRPDVVVPVPDTARPAANSLARTLGVGLREGLIKNRYVARTFIMHGQERRALSVRRKLNPVCSQMKDKAVMLVDDSIVRGTTSREIVQMVRDAGARRVFLAITAPPLRFPCVYGIDMMTRGEFAAKDRTVEQVRRLVGADALVYQTYEGLVEAVAGPCRSSLTPRSFCTACFNGDYPTGITRRYLAQMERERQRWL
ncbi:amidophosphoribosyltransferase [candidate division WOR-3 bacterium]|nr:amidophosphoribosyltransferase [candidate division WOR-3 bacterium]